MFGKKENQLKNNEEMMSGSINLIGTGTIIDGHIVCKGDVRVDGTITGNVSSKSKVVIGLTGHIDGIVHCQNADISGYLNGNITVVESLFLKSTARVHGDIVTNKLIVESGAVFTGNCNMGVVSEKLGKNHASKERQAKETEEGISA